MDKEKVRHEIIAILQPHYPEMQVRLENYSEDPSKIAIFFVDPKYALLYPMQRFHYLSHLIPKEYQDLNLEGTVWFELAPGEGPGDLRFPDEDLIAEITHDVMKCVLAAEVLEALDNALCPNAPDAPRALCYGDYRNTKPILLARGFAEAELFDVFHVLMAQGGYCDCEFPYNVAEGSRLAAEYWRARADGREPYNPHKGG